MLKSLFFLLIFGIGILSKADNISLSFIDTYMVPKSNIIDFVVGTPGIVKVEEDKDGNYIVSPQSLSGKTYVLFLKPDGTNFYHFFEVSNSRGLVKNKNERMVIGTLSGKTSYDQKNKSNPYSLGAKLKIKTTENTRFLIGAETIQQGTDKISGDNFQVSFWELDYLTHYLSWNTFTEPTSSVPYYSPTRFRGYSLGTKQKNFEAFLWKGNQFLNNQENPNFSAQGLSIRGNTRFFDYKLNLNNHEDRVIPLTSTGFELFKAYHGLSFSSFNKKNLFQYTVYKNFNENEDFFTLKSASFNYEVAPDGTYSLFNETESFNQKYNLNILFSNEDNFTRENEKDIDTIPGIITTSIGYESDNVNNFFLNKTRFFMAYGKSDLVTFSGLTEYSLTVLDNARSESFFYSPRLSFYFLGNKTDGGWYLRNEYMANINKNYFLNLTEDSRNTLGVFKSAKRLNYGIYMGDSRFYNGTNDNSSRIIGSTLTYFIRDNLSTQISYEKTSSPNGNYGQGASVQVKGFWNRDFEMKGKLDYSENFDSIKQNKRSSYRGSIGFIWNFDYENGDVYSKIESGTKKVSGIVFNDKNFNGIRDSNEPVLPNIKLSIIKVGKNESTTDNNGYFSFSNFSKNESIRISVEDSNFSAGKDYLLNMNQSHSIEIPLYEHVAKKVYFKDKNGKNSLIPISFSCEKKNLLKKEIYTDHTLVYFPKDTNCEPEINENSSNLMIVDFKESDNQMDVEFQQIPKMISFSFENKVASIELNGRQFSTKNKEISIEVEEYEGLLDLKISKKCQIYPNMTSIPYISLKNQNFFKISCF